MASDLDQLPPHHFKHLIKGIGLILFARLSFTFLALFVRETSGKLPLPMIVFAQSFVSLILLLPFLTKHGWESFRPKRPLLMMVWVVFGPLSFFFMFLATRRITITESILLNNTAPLFVPLLLYLTIKRPLNHKLWPGIILGFIGIGWILRPIHSFAFQKLGDVELGGLFGLLSGIFLAAAFIAIALLRHEKLFPTLLKYYALSSIISLPLALYYWEKPSWLLVGILILIGILTLFTQWGLLKAFHYGSASVLSPFSYAAVVFGGLVDWLVYNQFLGWRFVFGVGLICVGGVLIVILGKPPPSPQEKKAH
jgi:drug/metabolite transporter (DMT)-like permease